jgi:hypothetical protein
MTLFVENKKHAAADYCRMNRFQSGSLFSLIFMDRLLGWTGNLRVFNLNMAFSLWESYGQTDNLE